MSATGPEVIGITEASNKERDQEQERDEAEVDMSRPLELTLVLAATRDMGIGRAGTLPWTGLKKEMAYFARVTKRLPAGAPPNAVNAVVMGRRTWDSIPPRFRPLKDRLNVVLSRSSAEPGRATPASAWVSSSSAGEQDVPADDARVLRARSLPEALERLRGGAGQRPLGRVFVVGGAQVYDAALALPEARRVLLTSVRTGFECDAFVSALRLEAPRWRRVAGEEMDRWVGEEVPAGEQEENGIAYEFQMWEREAMGG